ncbi:hypothetical protein ACFVWG_33930 [Kribbella sp. NPDC058245]|uniref:hypothetical protein n=1 Tax=Kribbella sp. NPDC058245 TaxID=3346399 RepID=UPI0036E9AE09
MSNEQAAPSTHDDDAAVPPKARVFDIRTVVGALIGFYGLVLVVVGLVSDSARELAKTGGVHANVWAGVVMAVFATVLLVWSRLRPVTGA